MWRELWCDGVKFKTGWDGLEEYRLGESVPDPDLKPGSRFSGCGDWYCRACFERCGSDTFDADREALAGMATEGKLEVLRGDYNLSAAEIVDARPYIPPGWLRVGTWLRQESLEVLVGDMPLFPSIRPELDPVTDDFNRRVEDATRAKGWPHGGDISRGVHRRGRSRRMPGVV